MEVYSEKFWDYPTYLAAIRASDPFQASADWRDYVVQHPAKETTAAYNSLPKIPWYQSVWLRATKRTVIE